jgi:hypothetical protein
MRKFVLALTASLLASIGLVGVTPAPARAADLYNCDHWDIWLAAENWYRANDPANDPSNLDSDRDGYACEVLAKSSPIQLADSGINREPDCYKTGVWPAQTTHCEGRNQYRQVYWLTYWKDAPAVKSAMVDTFAPQASRNSEVDAIVQYAVGSATSTQAVCMRTASLGFIKYQNNAERSSGAFVTLFGLGKKALNKTPGPGRLASTYMELGGDLAVTASRINVSESAVAYAANAIC